MRGTAFIFPPPSPKCCMFFTVTASLHRSANLFNQLHAQLQFFHAKNVVYKCELIEEIYISA